VTLIAIRIEPDFAEVLTDTLVYSQVEFFSCTKIETLPHMDAAVTGRGPTDLGHLWSFWRARYFESYADLDELQAVAPAPLQECWEQVEGRDLPGMNRDSAEVFHVGWSRAAGRFVGYSHRSENGFQPERLSDFTTAPKLQQDREPPTSVADWIELAESIYEESGYALAGRCQFGGDLILTRLERGSITHRRIHTIPQDDWRFRQMAIGSLHPLGQLGPCICGSGQPFLVCHMAPIHPQMPCPCPRGRGDEQRPFYDCHRVDPDSAQARQHWTEHPEDFHRTRAELREAWDRQLPDEPRFEPPQIIKPDAVGPPTQGLSRRDRRAAERKRNKPRPPATNVN